MATVILEGANSTYSFDPEDRNSYIGEGGMGRVFKGTDLNKHKPVAIKVLFRELTRNSNNIERSKIESTIRIAHKNLTEMLDFVELRGIYHTISEFLDGVVLSDKIQELNKQGQTLSLPEIKRITNAVGEGLNEMHSRQLIHRDVKPSNIMLLKDGGVKLFDYSVIKQSKEVMQKLTSSGAIIGTIHYASPEQIRGDAVSANTDIYSLGITVYEMITGKVPFDGDSEFIIMERQTKELIPLHANLPKGFYNLLVNATAKKPEDRYQTINQFIDDLLKLPNGNVALLKNTWWRTRKFVISASAAAVLLIAIVAGFFLWQRHKKTMFTADVNKAAQFYSLAKYDSARTYYIKANELIKTDTIDHRILMLSALIPAMHDFYDAKYKLAYKGLEKAAKLGSGDAEYYLGELSYNGMGTIKDYKKGWQHSNKAVKMGFNMAYWRIANAYETGKGVQQDSNKADKLYLEAITAMKKLSEAGDPEAMGNLGAMYSNGSGAPENAKIAFSYYLKSANTGYAFIQNNLGQMYYFGSGVPKSLPEAAKWYSLSAAKGHPTSQLDLGNMYLYGVGLPQDTAKGLALIRRAADQDYSPALSKLGYLYYMGLFVPKDYNKSFDYTKKAVHFDNDNTSAIENLAYAYENGSGVAKDYAIAKDYYVKAIQLESRNMLTDIVKVAMLYYAGGYNLPQSDEKFVSFCEIAEKYGSADARMRLGIYYNMKGTNSFREDHNYRRARQYFKIAYAKGNVQAGKNLTYMDNNGY